MGDHYGETDSRVLQRDCAAVSVPWGKAETLPEGAYALVTQRLGGSITTRKIPPPRHHPSLHSSHTCIAGNFLSWPPRPSSRLVFTPPMQVLSPWAA